MWNQLSYDPRSYERHVVYLISHPQFNIWNIHISFHIHYYIIYHFTFIRTPIFEILNIQLDSEAVRTKTIETRWNECEIIYISSTFLCLCPHCLAIRLNLNISKKAYWPAPNISGFIAQLVRASHRYHEVTGSKPWNFQASIRNCINRVHNCKDHSLLDSLLRSRLSGCHATLSPKRTFWGSVAWHPERQRRRRLSQTKFRPISLLYQTSGSVKFAHLNLLRYFP